MPIVTISRQYGAGGHHLAERLQERLGLRLVDAAIVEELAQKAKLSPNWLAAVEKEASSTLLSALSSIVSRGGLFYKTAGHLGEKSERDKYREFLTRVFSTLAFEGHYVIVGRGSQFILKGHPQAAHIMLVADHDSRVNFLLRHYDISRSEAEKIIREKERERASIASKLFDADINDLNYYHMVLNTGLMPFETAVDIATDFVERFLKLLGGDNGAGRQGRP